MWLLLTESGLFEKLKIHGIRRDSFLVELDEIRIGDESATSVQISGADTFMFFICFH